MDIYQVHNLQVHNLVAVRPRLARLRGLQQEGKVGVVGVTHYQRSAYPEVLRLVRAGEVEQIQIPYNAVERLAERELLPAAADAGVGVLVMRPLGEGALVRRSPPPAALAPLVAFGVSTRAQALLEFIVSDPRVSCAIPATSNPERMRENAAAGSLPWFDNEAREYVARLAASR